MRKVSIIGCAGAGKSTFAVELGSLLDLPVIHIDAVFWGPDWERPPPEEWQRRHRELLARDAWIMDGNYGGTMKERIGASESTFGNPAGLVSFHLSFPGVQTGAQGQGRGRSRPDLHPGCMEKLPDGEFLKWIWDYPKTRLPGVLQLLEGVMHEKRVVILRSNADVAGFLDTLKPSGPQSSTIEKSSLDTE